MTNDPDRDAFIQGLREFGIAFTDQEADDLLSRADGIVRKATRDQQALNAGQAFQCPACDMVSYHPQDIQYGYCGNCHAFTRAGITDPQDVRTLRGLLARMTDDTDHA